jgi:hypothetical protein
MNFRTHKLAAVALVMSISVLLSGWACSESSLHKASRAAKQVADDLHAFEAQIEQQYAAGNLDKAEAVNLAQLCSQATLADDVFVQKVQSLPKLDSSSAPQVAAWFAELTTSIGTLEQQGVLHIKNPTAQQNFSLIVTSINTGLTILEGLLQGFGQPVTGMIQ